MTQAASPQDLIPFENFEIGQVQTFGAYEVTKEEIIEFAEKYDPQFFHLDEEKARESLFGGLCASGWHTCAMTMSMLVENMKTRGKSLGSPGIDALRWKHPVFPGDILSVRMEVIDLIKPKSRNDVGFVVSQTTVSTQNGVEVMEFVSKGIFPRTKPATD